MEAIKHIFKYLNGVPHTIRFDNDSSLVKVTNLENGTISKTLSDTFQRFKLHYEFKEVFKNIERGYEKGTVEQAVRFMRRNLLVPLPEFSDFDLYNKELLKRSSELLKREHYVLKQPIEDLHYEDINELTPDLVRNFIEKVVVHQVEKTDGKRKQTVEIFYNGVGAIPQVS